VLVVRRARLLSLARRYTLLAVKRRVCGRGCSTALRDAAEALEHPDRPHARVGVGDGHSLGVESRDDGAGRASAMAGPGSVRVACPQGQSCREKPQPGTSSIRVSGIVFPTAGGQRSQGVWGGEPAGVECVGRAANQLDVDESRALGTSGAARTIPAGGEMGGDLFDAERATLGTDRDARGVPRHSFIVGCSPTTIDAWRLLSDVRLRPSCHARPLSRMRRSVFPTYGSTRRITHQCTGPGRRYSFRRSGAARRRPGR
jgi:hypothetical protein